jgi:hypothetical protein
VPHSAAPDHCVCLRANLAILTRRCVHVSCVFGNGDKHFTRERAECCYYRIACFVCSSVIRISVGVRSSSGQGTLFGLRGLCVQYATHFCPVVLYIYLFELLVLPSFPPCSINSPHLLWARFCSSDP